MSIAVPSTRPIPPNTPAPPARHWGRVAPAKVNGDCCTVPPPGGWWPGAGEGPCGFAGTPGPPPSIYPDID